MGEVNLTFDNTFTEEFPELCQPWSANAIENPVTILVNEPLARDLGIDPAVLASRTGADLMSGTVTPPGARPVAQAYAGHQFGGYSPRLGDGRALLVGEIVDPTGRRFDLHLKGSGRTPFARGGDGKAVLGPMVREFIIGEAMHGLGIPTTRALGIVATGESIARETLLPGGVLARIASSHIRVGTFQYAAALKEEGLVRRLADYVMARHPSPITESVDGPDRYLAFLESIVVRQAHLIARWMLVGFIHGVMNTDNMTVSGETIDFGPCAFMDAYDPATVFSSIDTGGRYAYGNQPQIGQWNLARLAETLLPLIDEDQETSIEKAMAVLQRYPDVFQEAWASGMRSKLGLPSTTHDQAVDTAADTELFNDLLALMHAETVDYTSFFRRLADSVRTSGPSAPSSELRLLFLGSAAFDEWFARWIRALEANGVDLAAVPTAMDDVNPVYIARNHVVEAALTSAMDGDVTATLRLVERLRQPFTEVAGFEDLAGPAPAEFAG
ncbi:MAG: hypothetical protein RLZ37_298, partial [Actinomycetota bacterium]